MAPCVLCVPLAIFLGIDCKNISIYYFSSFLQVFENASSGVRDQRTNRINRRYIILLTDGLSSDRKDPSHVDIDAYVQRGVVVYVVAIGQQISSTTLHTMASTEETLYQPSAHTVTSERGDPYKLVFSVHDDEAFNSFWIKEMDSECNGNDVI